ncbi:efflux RND transporter periplasmic adaptor subunit [Candidatus Peregrinibacteria bacterium]|nr:efflux RND transporter periplasmic adaptor subunit [Candidatus Peregrinibacteria bacterium]
MNTHAPAPTVKLFSRRKWKVGFAIFFIVVIAFLMFPRPVASSKPAIPKIKRIPVVAQTLAQSRRVRQTLSFPAMIVSQQEAKVVAKSSGTVQEARALLGDSVAEGALLLVIDDSSGNTLKSGPVNQAQLASDQAGVSYRLAQASYQNILESSQRDLLQAEISKNQAQTGNRNTQSIAEASLNTATLAVEQARLALENRIVSATQSEADAETNAALVAETAINTCKTLITNVNNLTGLDEDHSVVVPYSYYLGATRSQTLIDAQYLYKETKRAYSAFLELRFSDASDKVQKTLLLAEKVKALADATKLLLDNTISGSLLPQSSPTGASLSGLQSGIAGIQSQINGTLVQLNGAQQLLANVALGNQTGLDALQKAYEMARQNLESMKANSGNQVDQAGFGQDQAENQFENLKIKLDSQVAAAKAQLDSARLQYENSLVGLNSLSGNYRIPAPIAGVVTRKLFSVGDTVSPGQLLMTLSRSDLTKAQFFVDQETLPSLAVGMVAQLRTSAGTSFEARVTSISTRADEATKRFMVEAEPKAGSHLALGTVADIFLDLDQVSQDPTHFILPLSAIDVGQNGNRVTLAQDGQAQKAEVAIVRISGEVAEIAADFPPDALIVVEGNRLAQEGDYLRVKN